MHPAGIDTVFAGPIAQLYEQALVPLIFEPYAADLARRVALRQPSRVLEIAAGTGVVTRQLANTLPPAVPIVATDLNQPMLDQAAAVGTSRQVEWRQADAMQLPFADQAFDAVVCQFGVMFFPDRVAAYREARRVLRPGGTFLFNAWDRIERNLGSDLLVNAVAGLFPDSPEGFFRRVPFSYHDVERIETDLLDAGFETVEIETVEKRCRAASARDAAIGLCQGTPLRSEIEPHGPDALERATDAAAAALDELEGPNGLDAPMSAHVAAAVRG